MSNKGNIDDIFKDKLSELEIAPSDALWGRIETDLNNKPGRKKFWIFSLMILLVSFMAVGGFFYEKPTSTVDKKLAIDTETISSEVPKTKNNHTEKRNLTPESTNNLNKTTNNLANTETIATTRGDERKNEIRQTKPSTENKQTANKRQQLPAHKADDDYNFNKTTSGTKFSGVKKDEGASLAQVTSSGMQTEVINTLAQETPSAKSSDLTTGFEPNFIHSLSSEFPPILPLLNQNRKLEKSNENKRQWMVGIFAGANWNTKRLSFDSDAQILVVDSILSRESNTTTFSYGALVTMKWKRHWRLTTGISYSKWCRKAVYPLDIPFDPNSIASNPNGNYNQDLGGPTGGQSVNVPNEQFNDYEALSPIPASIEFELQVHECYEIVSIPLRLGYELFFSEFSLIPEIGVGYNRVIGNKLEADASNDLNPVEFERQDNYNKDMFSLSGSIGVERYLSPQFKIGINGVCGYAVTPLYKSNQFSTHPYTISGQVRLWYIFSK